MICHVVGKRKREAGIVLLRAKKFSYSKKQQQVAERLDREYCAPIAAA